MDENAPVRDYKTRNILSLEERVEVISAFEHNPVYQRLAEQFNCSGKQIKNIIANKEAIMLYYKKCYMEAKDGSATDARYIKRHQKIVFLGEVIYEFVQRALYHGVAINSNSVCQKALEVKEAIAIDNFYPNNAWIRNFKINYKIPEFDTNTLKMAIPLVEHKKSSFNAIDLVNYVSQCEKNAAAKQQQQHQPKKPNENGISAIRIVLQENGSSSKPTIGYESDEVMETDENSVEILVSLDSDEEQVDESEIKLESHTTSEVTIEKPTLAPLPDLVSYQAAMQRLNKEDIELNATPEVTYKLRPLPDVTSYHEETEIKIESPATPEEFIEAPTLPPLPDVASYQEALRHLKVLEDFAMLEDNYRAIGLITQLEQVFKNPPKRDDFET